MNTNSKKVNELVARAEKLGLNVTVDVENDAYFETITATITRGMSDYSNALGFYYSSGTIIVTATRYLKAERKTFKTFALMSDAFASTKKLTLNSVAIRLGMWADDLNRYNAKEEVA